MKRNKGFTLVELVAAMGIMVVLLNSFVFMMAGSAANLKQDKIKIRVISYAQYFMQTMKSYGKQYFRSAGVISYVKKDKTEGYVSCSGYFYFNSKDDIDNIIGSKAIKPDDFKNDISYIISGTGVHSGKVFKGSYSDMINKSKPDNRYGAYFELAATDNMGKNEEKGASGNVELSPNLGLQNIRIYIKIMDLKSQNKQCTELTYYIGR